MLGAQRKMAINIEHRRIWTMMDPEYLDPRETSAIKVEKIDFPKTKLARLALKPFLYWINSQTSESYGLFRLWNISIQEKHARSQHAFIHLPKWHQTRARPHPTLCFCLRWTGKQGTTGGEQLRVWGQVGLEDRQTCFDRLVRLFWWAGRFCCAPQGCVSTPNLCKHISYRVFVMIQGDRVAGVTHMGQCSSRRTVRPRP